MDQGTDVIDILAGRVIPLRFGYVPVINRGQKDIEAKKTIRDALKDERNFLKITHHTEPKPNSVVLLTWPRN